MRAILFVMVLSIMVPSTAALAAVPGLMSYQGTLTEAYGVAMDTTVSMTFVIYPGSLAVDGIWAETQPAVAVNDGIFNVLLGRVNALYADVFNGTSRWLGVQVGDDPELAPRQRIVSVGYAFQAAQADTAAYAKNVPSASDGDWNIYGDNLYSAVSGNVAIGSSGAYKLHVEDPSDSAGTYAILGVKTSTGTAQHLYGVCGHTLSSAVTGAGAGVLGLASDPDGGSAGVRGEAQGEVGRGVFAWATHGSGVNYGLYAVSSSPNGYAGYFESGKTYFGGDVGIGTAGPTEELHVVGDIYCTGKLTSDGGNDPPYVLYNRETREAIIKRVSEEIPEDKLGGAVLFWNGDDLRFEVYLPERGEFRDLQGNLLSEVSALESGLLSATK